jgi:hypothetical protein
LKYIISLMSNASWSVLFDEYESLSAEDKPCYKKGLGSCKVSSNLSQIVSAFPIFGVVNQEPDRDLLFRD